MPLSVFQEYSKAVDVIISEEQLGQLEVEFAPHLKKQDRKELVRKHKNRINSLVNRTQGRVGTLQDVAKAFARMKTNG